jgi:hypothetical protein
MKKLLLAFVLAFVLMANVHGQATTFTVTPSNTIAHDVEEDDYVDFTVYFTNTTGSNINYKWSTVSNSLPSGWNLTLCDYPSCFPYVPNSGSMDPVSPGAQGLLKLTVNPGTGNLGAGSVVFSVWDENFPTQKETITMEVNAIVGIEDQLLASQVKLYPNPATDRLFLSHSFGTLESGLLSILDLNGAEVMKVAVGSTATQEVNISTLPAGMYMVRYQTSDASLTQKVVKTH